jgi:hypothetical protein
VAERHLADMVVAPHMSSWGEGSGSRSGRIASLLGNWSDARLASSSGIIQTQCCGGHYRSFIKRRCLVLTDVDVCELLKPIT